MQGVVYLCGPITGVPDYKSRFAQAESELSARGYTVLNPAKLPKGLDYGQYMDIDRVYIAQSEYIVCLDGWQNSDGAKTEVKYAQSIGVKIGSFYNGELELEDKK